MLFTVLSPLCHLAVGYDKIQRSPPSAVILSLPAVSPGDIAGHSKDLPYNLNGFDRV